jgi:hypothetical protein
MAELQTLKVKLKGWWYYTRTYTTSLTTQIEYKLLLAGWWRKRKGLHRKTMAIDAQIEFKERLFLVCDESSRLTLLVDININYCHLHAKTQWRSTHKKNYCWPDGDERARLTLVVDININYCQILHQFEIDFCSSPNKFRSHPTKLTKIPLR